MTMDVGQKAHLSQRMRNVAKNRTCPACGRRAAITTWEMSDRWVNFCHWVDRGKCDWQGEVIWKALP